MRSIEITNPPKGAARRWAAANRMILKNAGALSAGTLITAGLGFAFWWFAARVYPADAVGVASALVSTMLLLASLSVLGLETLLLGELRRDPRTARSLFTTAVVGAGSTGALIGLTLPLLLPYLSTELRPVRESIASVVVFAIGVSVTALALVLDNAFVGLLRGELQLLRNAIHAVAKLGLLALAGYFVAGNADAAIVGAWVFGTVVSLGLIAAFPRLLPATGGDWRPRWSLLLEIKGTALAHHVLNVVLQTPLLVLPIVAAVQVSVVAAAHFYAAFMTAAFLFVLPLSLTTALYAFSNPDRAIVATSLRHTFAFSLLAGTVGAAVLVIGAPMILRSFGTSYEAAATDTLRVLSLAVFPVIVRSHYVTINRVRRRMGRTAIFFAVVGFVEIAMASVGAAMYGLLGLSVAWLMAVSFGAVLTLPTVIRALRSGTPDLSAAAHPDLQIESVRLS